MKYYPFSLIFHLLAPTLLVFLIVPLAAEAAPAVSGTLDGRIVDSLKPGTGYDRANDVRIGGTREGAGNVALDFHATSGNLFTVVEWSGGWTLNMSTDGGASWSETYEWVTANSVYDVDLTVVADWVYIGYVDTGSSSEGRLRRCSALTGAVDAGYHYWVVADATPHDIWEVELESNADGGNDTIHFFAGQSDGTIRFLTDDADDGTTFWEIAGLSGFAAGLDATYNEGGFEHLFLSWVGDDLAVHVAGYGLNWTRRAVEVEYTGHSPWRTAISAYDDTVICVYSHGYPTYGVRARISYSSGASWVTQAIAEPLPGESVYLMPDVSARGGAGMTVIYQFEEGAYDNMYMRVRPGYEPGGSFEEQTPFNDQSVSILTWTAINQIPPASPGAGAHSFGMIYVADNFAEIPYFDRLDGLDSAGDNCGDPIPLSLPADLPVMEMNSTCGRGNDYDATCMGSYDGGEDLIYEIDVTATVTVDIRLTADAASYPEYAGMAVFADCPAVDPDSCIASGFTSLNPDLISGLVLTPGTYYLMVDSWPPPDCADIELVITPHCELTCPGGALDEGETCGSNTNGGCNMPTPGFTGIACGDTVCGTGWRDDDLYDGDWYEVVLAAPVALTWTVQAEFYVMIGLIESTDPGSGDCADITGYVEPCHWADPCGTASVTTGVLPAGTHWLYVVPQWGRPDVLCGISDEYVATLSCTPFTTVGASLTCVPGQVLLPDTVTFSATLSSLDPDNTRRAAGRIDVVLGSGASISNWKSGWTNLSPLENHLTSWGQNFPALGSLEGPNTFTLDVEDVTPAPYNQPPYLASGDTATDDCMVYGTLP